MNLQDIITESITPAPYFKKFLDKAEKKIKSEMKWVFQHNAPNLEIKLESSYKARITLEFQHWLDSKDIDAADEDFKFAIEQADTEDNIHKLEIGDASGSEFYEVVLGGLRPGMNVKAEAFFPTLEYVVTFKQLIRKS